MPPKRRRSAAAKAPAESAPAEPDPPAEAAASAAAAADDDLEAPAKRRRGWPAKDAAAAADDEGGGTSHKFQREIRAMMYGFGDDLHPLPQSVALVEDMAVDYLHQVLRRASDAAAERQHGGGGGAARVQERDLLFAVRKDAKRVARLQELLDVYEEQKEARHDKPEKYEESDDDLPGGEDADAGPPPMAMR